MEKDPVQDLVNQGIAAELAELRDRMGGVEQMVSDVLRSHSLVLKEVLDLKKRLVESEAKAPVREL